MILEMWLNYTILKPAWKEGNRTQNKKQDSRQIAAINKSSNFPEGKTALNSLGGNIHTWATCNREKTERYMNLQTPHWHRRTGTWVQEEACLGFIQTGSLMRKFCHTGTWERKHSANGTWKVTYPMHLIFFVVLESGHWPALAHLYYSKLSLLL